MAVIPLPAIGYNWKTGTRTIRPHYHAMALIMNHLGLTWWRLRVSSPIFAVDPGHQRKVQVCRSPSARGGFPFPGATASFPDGD